MLDETEQEQLQRSSGKASVVLASRDNLPRLVRLYQSGSAKVFLPRGTPNEAVFLNTSGGLTGGDRISFSLALGEGVTFAATTQTAERAYASSSGVAKVGIRLNVGARGRLDWLPQETLLYQRSALQRETRVDLATTATVLLCETVILGRQAMGEVPDDLLFQDRRSVWRDGRLIWSERQRLDPLTLARQGSTAILRQARCFATIALIGQAAVDLAGSLAPDLDAEGCETAVSAWDGRMILRVTAHDNWPFRQHVARLLIRLRGCPLPRVWQMNGDIT